MSISEKKPQKGELTVIREPLDLFRPHTLDVGVARSAHDEEPSSRISRPPSEIIVAKNSLLGKLFENSTGVEAAKVLEDIMRKLGGNAIDLSWTDLSQRRLNGLKLPYVNLRCAVLNFTELSGADIRGANLSEALGRRTDFTGANLVGANLTGANLPDASLSDTKLQGIDWTDANISGSTISGATFAGGVLMRTSLVNCGFSEDKPPITAGLTRLGPVYTSGDTISELFVS